MSRPWQETNRWYCVRYTLPVNEGGKPEIVVLRAESEDEGRLRVTEHFIKKCRGVFGVPEIVSVESFESWEHVKESIGVMNNENNK